MSGDKSWLTRFRSMKTGLILVLAIIIASIAGTLIPQQDLQGPAGWWYSWLQLNDVFHSWWFAVLLILAALNLMACSFYRLKTLQKDRRRVKPLLSGDQVSRFKDQAGLCIVGNCSEVSDRIIKLLNHRGYNTWADGPQAGEFRIGAEHGRLSVWGSVITHFSFLIIMLGVLAGAVFGFQGSINAPVGAVFGLDSIPGTGMAPGTQGFKLRIDDFQIERYDDATPSGYFSRVSIIEGEAAPQTATIGVNQPLLHQGVKFYQASYGEAIEVIITAADNRVLKSGLVMPGQRFAIPGTDYSVATIPATESGLDTAMPPSSRQLAHAVFQGSQHIETGEAEIDTPINIGTQGHTVKFTGIVPYTGLLVKKDPGVPMIWLGSVFLLIGMGMSFFLRPHQLWLVLHQNGAQVDVVISGAASKNQSILAEIIAKIAHEINGLSTSQPRELSDKGVLFDGNV